MSKTLTAVYENGALRPLEPLPLQEHQQVTTTIDPDTPDDALLDLEYLRRLDAMELPEISLQEVESRLSKIPGSLTADFIAEREERLLRRQDSV